MNEVSFELLPGRRLGVVGESGSGKTSLGRLLIKLLKADGGKILFEGRDIAGLSEAEFRPLRPRVQMIFQDPFASLNPRSTVGHILTVGPVAHGTPYAQASTSSVRSSRTGPSGRRSTPRWTGQSIIDALYYGVPTATETFMPQRSFYYNPNLPVQEFNLDRAREILDEAGWAPGPDGIRAKDGVRLAFSNSTTSGNHLREQAQQFLQQTFAEIGVEMTISNLPAAVMWGEYWAQSQFDTAMVGITYLIGADPDVTNRFHTRAIAAQGGSGSNNAQYSDAEVDALLEEGSRTFDPEARRAIYHRVQELVRRDLPFLPLFQNTSVQGHKEGLHGVVRNPNTRTESWNAATWYWAS